MPTDYSSPPSLAANKVGSCEDLVTEILLRLPVRSLTLFKSVSKHWYSVIKNHPCFKNKNPKPADPPSGLFVPTILGYMPGYVFVPFDIHNPVKFPFTSLNNIDPDLVFKHSCNGLMLCGKDICISDDKVITDKNYVYNPTINQFFRLPVSGIRKHVLGMSIAFDPLKSPHYKIIYVYSNYERLRLPSHNYQIDMYSSQTRTCKLSYKLTITRFSLVEFTTGVYWNNAIHWIDSVGFIVYFDLDQEMTYEIKTPFARLSLNYKNYHHYIFESRDQLLLVEIYCPLITKFKIYELKRDYSHWLVKYHVNLEEFGGSLFPESVKRRYFQYDCVLEFDVLSLVLGGNEDESFLVVEIPGKIMRLNLESKTHHKLHEFTSSPRILYCPGLYQWPNVYQFAASLYSL